MFIASLAVAASLMGQTQPQPDPQATAVEDVVVSARPLDAQVRSFLDDVALPERTLRMARWYRHVCVGTVNMRGASAQYVVDRVSEIGLEIGLEPGEPGCTPNIMIFASDNGAELAKGMVKARPRVFHPGGTGMVRTRAALSRFQDSDASIRWWHVSMPMDSDTNTIAVRLPGEEPPMVGAPSSRLRTEIRNDIGRVFIILDINKLEGMSMTQVADYVAMVAYSQIDSDADFSGYDSVLAMMSDRSKAGMTSWDMAYLKALYSAELTQVQKNHQIGEIARLMEIRQLRPEIAAANDEGEANQH